MRAAANADGVPAGALNEMEVTPRNRMPNLRPHADEGHKTSIEDTRVHAAHREMVSQGAGHSTAPAGDSKKRWAVTDFSQCMWDAVTSLSTSLPQAHSMKLAIHHGYMP